MGDGKKLAKMRYESERLKLDVVAALKQAQDRENLSNTNREFAMRRIENLSRLVWLLAILALAGWTVVAFLVVAGITAR